MDYVVSWSPEATEDLESIAEYISRDSQFYAKAVVTRILAISRTIAEQPHAGRIVPELMVEQIRERLVYSYRLVYKIKSNDITIIAIIHGKRLLDNVSNRLP